MIAAAVALGAGAPAASAIPWDQGGLISPGLTPAAASPDPLCLESYANDAPDPGSLGFGIGPRLAGESGTGQTTPLVPEDWRKRDAALKKLAGKGTFTLRLNRLFMADGQAGIKSFQKMARHFGKLGMNVELQVRYHPLPGQEGDIRAWVAYVKKVVKAFGPIRSVTGLQITNEVNLTFSPNTSDGAYPKAANALVQGVKAAKNESRRLGYRQLKIGFNFAWRFGSQADADFWTNVRTLGGKAFRRSTDWIGVDMYPGTFSPGQATIFNYRDAFLEGLAQMRECYLPLAGFGKATPLRVEETGWPTGPGRTEEQQKQVLDDFVKTAVDYAGTYNLTDFRWFGLRDNNSSGPNFQSFFGLLNDDYSRKPAFGEYRRLVSRFSSGRSPGRK